eukprot:UN05784
MILLFTPIYGMNGKNENEIELQKLGILKQGYKVNKKKVKEIKPVEVKNFVTKNGQDIVGCYFLPWGYPLTKWAYKCAKSKNKKNVTLNHASDFVGMDEFGYYWKASKYTIKGGIKLYQFYNKANKQQNVSKTPDTDNTDNDNNKRVTQEQADMEFIP